ncbi:hypothetical protein EJT82_20650 [Salmonella enterica]|nr:hypothetical protein [Salmonella enterica]EAQ0262074.1 hypothetical protein [Salmonella enterica]EAT1424902.1 hypothetical protein [Salmonella enterica]
MWRHTVELPASSTAARQQGATNTDGNWHDFRYGWAIAGKEAHQQAEIQREGNLYVVICCIVQHTNTTHSIKQPSSKSP